MKNIVILISGTGSNMAAIVTAARHENWESRLQARIAAVISNRPQAPGLVLAQQHGIATGVVDHRSYADRAQFDQALAQEVDRHDPNGHPALVVLAGFMRVLTPTFVDRYRGRLVNIHPSLLPAFTGLHTHQRAIDAGCRVAGATVHLVTAELDNGPILAQAVVPILATDTAHSLSARVVTQEHRIYPAAIVAVLRQQ